MSFSIAGKTAIVTGAAAGIGGAIARHFHEEGANVVFADLNDKRLKAAAEDLAEDERVRLFAGDLREKLQIANLLSAAIDAFDRVDILVNAAREFCQTDPLDPADTTVDAALNTNLLLALRLSQAVARRMIAQAEEAENPKAEAGSIINLGAAVPGGTQHDLLAYAVSTAAATQMTRSLALALAPHRIRVNALSFGSVMSARLRDYIAENPEARDEIIAGTPLRRIGTASELAEAAQFLASGASSFITGQVLTCDGGRGLIEAVRCPVQ
jgi:7-alpha-hydroxysteroid dehydrogenase